ncbi:hypothetical protein QN219_06465 [Sinorhizobium sp. 7-81]|uniref:hypothetical protein n=1 Tax=Sinorhizobium sp. 8-89 TaxID=3049089 RepID=UPI0024C41531|nr:hypothetical protein [Sinorhizobium sp. 8-89]MDK1489701.1 hypothetical protein [Sinorhizobium sp. 8-89]
MLFDIEGRPLRARFIAGRNMVGHGEKALSTTELNAITAATTGSSATAVAPRILRGDAGTSFNRYTGEPTEILIANDLSEAQAGKIPGHEVGHVIDQLAGEIPAEGLLRPPVAA